MNWQTRRRRAKTITSASSSNQDLQWTEVISPEQLFHELPHDVRLHSPLSSHLIFSIPAAQSAAVRAVEGLLSADKILLQIAPAHTQVRERFNISRQGASLAKYAREQTWLHNKYRVFEGASGFSRRYGAERIAVSISSAALALAK